MTEKQRNIIIASVYASPCGELVLGSTGESLCLCDWLDSPHRQTVANRLNRILGADITEGTSPVIESAARQLDEYFGGVRKSFDMPLNLAGTPFQKSVWQALLAIPYGSTPTYAEIARIIGHKKAVRAVASAIGANALSILVPCHRVVGADGTLTGYAGGLDAKRYLLRLENAVSTIGFSQSSDPDAPDFPLRRSIFL